MNVRTHKPACAPLVASVMLVVTCFAPCAPKVKSADEQSAEKIKARIEKAVDAWSSEPEETRPSYDAKMRQVLDSMSQNEIRLVAQYLQEIDVEEEAFRRWARFDPAGALKAVRAVEDANAAEIRLAGTGLEGRPGEAMSGWVFGMYLGALDGWSEVAPKAAWESFKKREGSLSKSLVVDDYLHYFYQVLFDHLATVDPDLAFQELIQFRADKYEEMFTASMLAGYLHSAPRGRDWHKEADRLLERKWDRGDVYAEIRTALMGRWLEDAPEAAEKWFREGDVEDLHWSYVEPPHGDVDPFASDEAHAEQQQDVKERRRDDLGSAAGYWAARDFPTAWRWMKSYSGFRLEGFPPAVFDGMSAFFNEESWGDQAQAQGHCLKQVAKLPNQADRDQFVLRFSNVLWVFDDTEFFGEPPPDKGKWLESVRKSLSALRPRPETADAIVEKLKNQGNSEDGANQPATAPESKPEGEEKPKPESEVRPQ
jgi:hypothetical protein